MSTQEMSINARRQYLQVQQKRYRQASRKEKSRLLDEMAAVTGLHRKYLVHLMASDLARRPRERQRGRTYDEEVEAALLVVAESLDFICGKRLQPALLATARHLQRHGELQLSPQVERKLAQISASSIDRLLARHRNQLQRRLPRKPPTPSSALAQVPMQVVPWDEQEPGHLEVDLVWHCGQSTHGDFVYTLQAVDVATGWSERYALLGRSALVTQDAFRVLRHRFPFPLKQIHTDNGPEFLSAHMLRFWPKLAPGILLTRNQPWRKNDSRFVEQKNFTLVRAYLGYGRFDTVAQTRAMNHLYQLMGLYYNLFQPVMRLQEKIFLPAQGPRPTLKRRYDTPQTPFQRLCATGLLAEPVQNAIQELRQALNPRQLRRMILQLIEEIKAMPSARPDEHQDVFLTLSNYQPYTVEGGWNVRLDYHLTPPLPLTLPEDSPSG